MFDEYEKSLVERVANMGCASFFYTAGRILEEEKPSRSDAQIAWDCSEKIVNAIWEMALKIQENNGGPAVSSLFINLVMSKMCLDIMKNVVESALVSEAEDVLKRGE